MSTSFANKSATSSISATATLTVACRLSTRTTTLFFACQSLTVSHFSCTANQVPSVFLIVQ